MLGTIALALDNLARQTRNQALKEAAPTIMALGELIHALDSCRTDTREIMERARTEFASFTARALKSKEPT